jgi:thiamine kinase-like enzyme
MANSKLTLKSVSKTFTEDILLLAARRAVRSDDVSISSHKVAFGTEKGDGYMGIVYRISLQLSNGTALSLIAKGLPPNLVRRRTFNTELFFKKEVEFFNLHAPMLRAFEIEQRGQEKALTDTFLPIAECYYAVSDGENDFLIFQDLRELNYGMADRISGPNEKQRTAILHTLARYHALSLAMQVVRPEKFEIFKSIPEAWLSMDKAPTYANYMHKMFLLWHRAIKDGLKGTDCLKRFEALGPDPTTLFEKICAALRVIEPCVVTHGDTWSTNFLYKDEKIMMIDFQIVRYCSAMSDISVYLFSCTTEEQRDAAGGTDAILMDYYRVLSDAVKELKVPKNPLSWDQMMEQWKVSGLNGFACALELVPLSMVETEDVQDLDRMEGSEAIDLALLVQFKDISDVAGKKRLMDLTKLAADYNII